MFIINLLNSNYSSLGAKDKVLIDYSSTGKTIDWQGKKLRTIELSESYKRIGKEKKAFRIKDCGTFLEYRRFLEDNTRNLYSANFCKVRLCPMCSWRRSLKIFGQVSKIMEAVTEENDYEYIFLTLTTRNCDSTELAETIDNIFKSFGKLVKRKKYKQSIKGHFRALEITHNLTFDTYHPHLHCILVVNKSYFKDSKYYISQKEWCSIWRKCLKVDYNPIVDVRKFKDRSNKGMEKSIAETAKYTVKSDDYIIRDDISGEIIQSMTDLAVFTLDLALANRRLTAFGGILKEYHKKLNLDDAEDGDLVNTDNVELRKDVDFIVECYSWNIGYKQYLRVE